MSTSTGRVKLPFILQHSLNSHSMSLKINKTGRKPFRKAARITDRFQQLRDDIAKLKQNNQLLQDTLQQLIHEYERHILPIEKDHATPLTVLIHKLLDFTNRKTLAQWQRAELMDWIMELISELRLIDPATADTFSAQYDRRLAALYGYTDTEYDEMLAQQDEADKHTRNRFENGYGDDRPNENEPEDFRVGDEMGDETLSDEEFFTDDPFSKTNRERERPTGKLARDYDAWLKSLFRRTAQALHPDREQDEARREEKHRLMSALLEARDNQDIVAMLDLYSAHVTQEEAAIEHRLLPLIIEELEWQKAELSLQKQIIIDQSPFHQFLYRQFYAKREKTRQRKMDEYKARVERDIEARMTVVKQISSVKVLKELLELRVGILEEGFPL